MADKVNMSLDDVTKLNRSQQGGRCGAWTPTKAEEKLAIPKRKRKRSHPELPQEAVREPRSGLQTHFLESPQGFHALGKSDEKADPSSSRALGNSSDPQSPQPRPVFKPPGLELRRGEGAVSNGVYVLPSAARGDVKPVVSSTHQLDFLKQLEDYAPTITDPVAPYYLDRAGLEAPEPQATGEVSTASLCQIGQEMVQDIVYRTMEIFQLLRNVPLPNGVPYPTGAYQDRLAKLQDHLRQLPVLFRKLRLVYDKCNENCGGLDPVPVEQLIPFVEEDGSKNDDRAGPPRFASEERQEIAEVNKKLKQKNQQLKQIMDQLRNLIWDLNAMLAMRN